MKRSSQRLSMLAACLVLFALLGSVLPRVSGQGDDLLSQTPEGAGHGRRKAARDFYDVRENDVDKASAKAERRRQKTRKARKDKANRGQQMKEARESLRRNAPGADVKVNDELGTAEVVATAHGRKGRFLTQAAGAEHEQVVRGFVGRHAALYGLTARQVAHLKKTADYTNPDGNLSWVELAQEIKGVPVFQGELRAMITRDGELASTVGRLVPELDDAEVLDGVEVPAVQLTAAQAVAAGAASIGVALDPASLVLRESAPDGSSFVFERGPFDDDIKVEMVYFPLESGVVAPAWSMTLWQDVPAYYTLVDADEGEVLWQKNITDAQTQAATYGVYTDDSPAPLSPSNALPGLNVQGTQVPRTNVTVISEHPSNALGWLTDGATTTTGNNVDAGLDVVAPGGIDPGGRPVSPTRNFVFDFNPAPGIPGALGSSLPADPAYRMGAVTNIFFMANRYHDRLYELGFTEAARNFQQNNFGRNPAGLTANARNGNDRVLAEAQDLSGVNNANFSTGTDGNSGRMQMFLWPNTNPDRDGDFDNEIVIHELTHGTSNRLHNNASGLNNVYSRGMGEGWGDFYARALLSTADEDVNGVYAMGAYATHLATGGYTNNYYYAIRRFPYAVKSNVGPNGRPHNPLTYADTNPNLISLTDGAFPRGPFGLGGRAGATAVHNIGEVWCMALLEVRARFIKRLGHAVGNQRMLQLVTDGMKNDPVGPTLIDARDSLLQVAAASLGPEDVQDIWAGFATRGMGFGATEPTVTDAAHKESFDNPLPGLESVTFNDASCNANGVAEPGEDLLLTVTLKNPLNTAVSGVTASIGGETANFGSIAAGATAVQQLLYTVPAAACAGELALSFVVNSDLGEQTKNYELKTNAQPVVTFTENFDGATSPALPSGWSALVNPVGSPVWRTVSTSTQSAPNAAFVNFNPTTSLSFLQSPLIPVTSDKARLTFRHSYLSEFEWDGAILQISLDGGTTFLDILDSGAGARFIEGGFDFPLVSAADGSTNLLQSRAGWTGNSGGFITTTVQLPAAAAGKSVRFRWISGADSAITVANSGWTIDNVALIEGYACAASNCQADLGVTQTVSPATVTTGSDLTYDITVTNHGPARATDVSVMDVIPVGTSFKSATGPAGWTAATPNVGQGGSVTFTKASLASGQSATFTLVVSADCGTPDGTVISNTATVAGTRPDPDNTNNSSTVTSTASDPAAVISGASVDTPVLWSPNHRMVDVAVSYGVADNCGGTTVGTALSVTSNEPVNGTGDGDTGPDWEVVNPHLVRLRAERAGGGTGRVYTITITATDVTGNTSAQTVTVTVPKSQK